MRMKVDIPPKLSLNFRPKGRKDRGRTRTSWVNSLEVGTDQQNCLTSFYLFRNICFQLLEGGSIYHFAQRTVVELPELITPLLRKVT